MNKFSQLLTAGLVLAAFSSLPLLADNQVAPAATHSSGNQLGNQLLGNQAPWYARLAESVAPAPGIDAAKGFHLTLQSGSVLYMEGDSTLHKYQMRAVALEGSAVLKTKPSKDLVQALQAGEVGSMSLVIPLKTFKSKESGLDNNAYKALKADQNPDITFLLGKETLKPGDKDGTYVMTATGDLTVAGVTAPVTLTADTMVKDGQVELKGVQTLKMTDFKVTPPSISLLVASITCTDEIAIHYDVIFAPEAGVKTVAGK